MAELSDQALAILCGAGVVFIGLNLTLAYLVVRRQMEGSMPRLWKRQEDEVRELHRRVTRLQEGAEDDRPPPAPPRPPG